MSNNWQPISTAPLDGTEVILWLNENGLRTQVSVAFFHSKYAAWVLIDNGNWTGGYDFAESPSHWMPIVKPLIG